LPDPVPFALYGLETIPDACGTFDEKSALAGSFSNYPGWELLDLMIGKK
jgi:2,3-bisphosphoglycerate-independent phosphoglycerate mutase